MTTKSAAGTNSTDFEYSEGLGYEEYKTEILRVCDEYDCKITEVKTLRVRRAEVKLITGKMIIINSSIRLDIPCACE